VRIDRHQVDHAIKTAEILDRGLNELLGLLVILKRIVEQADVAGSLRQHGGNLSHLGRIFRGLNDETSAVVGEPSRHIET
jgi:hypothetical protein